MPWVKLDDQFADHPKVLAAGPLAGWLYVCGLTYCGRLLTDGFIPMPQVRKLADVENAHQLAEILVRVGLWDRRDDGYQVHDYIEYNPTRKEVLAKRESDLERTTTEYRWWRLQVLKRDQYRCRACGEKDVPLHAHHLLPFARHPELRTSLKNGMTLCVPCHKEQHAGRSR